jgi:hypothetical protein
MKAKVVSRVVAVIAVVGLMGTAAQAGRGSGGGDQLPYVFFECHNVNNAPDQNQIVTITPGPPSNPFLNTGTHDVRVGPAKLLCVQVSISADQIGDFPLEPKDVHCYSISILTTPRPQVLTKDWTLDDPIGLVPDANGDLVPPLVRPSAPQYLCAVGVTNPVQ